jgi:Mg2+ and Co2+ transporter CorA
MNVTCLALEPGGALRPEPEATALARWREGAGPYWIHLGGHSPEEAAAWLAGLGLDPGLLVLMPLGEDETRIVPLTDAVFVAYPVPTEREDGKPGYFRFLGLERLLVTISDPSASGAAAIDEYPITRLRLREGTAAGVVCALALVHSGRLRRQVIALRLGGAALADRMDSDPRSVSLHEILASKRRVFSLASVVDEELAVLEVLKASDLPILPLGRLRDTFQIAIELMRATDRDMDRLERRVDDLQERYEAAQQEQTNRRLGLLTVISAIFMPLTLIAGIYGMNFEVMPELHYRWGYPVTLAGMALIAGGLGWYFHARWWRK